MDLVKVYFIASKHLSKIVTAASSFTVISTGQSSTDKTWKHWCKFAGPSSVVN